MKASLPVNIHYFDGNIKQTAGQCQQVKKKINREPRERRELLGRKSPFVRVVRGLISSDSSAIPNSTTKLHGTRGSQVPQSIYFSSYSVKPCDTSWFFLL
jgi:hypothetical protein